MIHISQPREITSHEATGRPKVVQTYQNGFCPIANLVPITDTGMVEINIAKKTTGTCTKDN